MFSVSAEPFNSNKRQLYGGWTFVGANGNAWGEKTWNEMAAKFSPDVAVRRAARRWLRDYRERVRADPEVRRQTYRAGKDYWSHAIKPAMTRAQKTALWEMFNNDVTVPFSTDDSAQRISSFLRHAPYWSYPVMNYIPDAGVPYAPPRADLGDPNLILNPDRFTNMAWRVRARGQAPRRGQRAAVVVPVPPAPFPVPAEDEGPLSVKVPAADGTSRESAIMID